MEHHFAQIMLHMHLVYANQVLLKDIKTQNIFLTKDHAVMKIGDFCISKILLFFSDFILYSIKFILIPAS